MTELKADHTETKKPDIRNVPEDQINSKPTAPLPNYTLSTVCPACGSDTYKLACKVRCARCGFMWDCSEL